MAERFDWRCPDCGYYRDTPNHELGCASGPPAATTERPHTDG